MGIGVVALDGLVDLHRRFGDFGRTVQIGRQGLYFGHIERQIADLTVRQYGLADSFTDIVGSDQYADEHLLGRFGADPILAADASAYEGATIVHDFNTPISEQYHGRFDTLLEFGSLEHIFNVPTAMANMMRMVKVGGRIMSVAPSNNWLGHGFYQFSPELPFRVYQPENGFEIVSVRLCTGGQSPVDLLDQGDRGARNEIGTTAASTDLITVARKIADVEPFRRWPQQGDYVHAWDRLMAAESGRTAGAAIDRIGDIEPVLDEPRAVARPWWRRIIARR